MRLLLKCIDVNAIEHDGGDQQHQRLKPEDDQIAGHGVACDLRGKVGDHTRHEQANESRESVRKAPRADVQADLFRDGQVEHERKVGNGGNAGAKSEQGDADIEHGQAGSQAADDNDHKTEQSAKIPRLGNVFFLHAPVEEARHNESDKRKCTADGNDARGLFEGHAEGLRAEWLEQHVLTEDGGEEQKKIDEEDLRNRILRDGGGHLLDGVSVRAGGRDGAVGARLQFEETDQAQGQGGGGDDEKGSFERHQVKGRHEAAEREPRRDHTDDHDREHRSDRLAAPVFAGEFGSEREITDCGEVVAHSPRAKGEDAGDDAEGEVLRDEDGDLRRDCNTDHAKDESRQNVGRATIT